jgi:hypothetical protein
LNPTKFSVVSWQWPARDKLFLTASRENLTDNRH